MKNYVVGFAISRDHRKVALILKNRPKWQIGLLNGIGGHIKEDETPAEAMIREFQEEAGLKLFGWDNFITLAFKDSIVWFFRIFVDYTDLETTTSPTDEEVNIYDIKDLDKLPVIPNLQWLIRLALDNEDFRIIDI